MKKLIAGNWKMNGSLDVGANLVSGIVSGLRENLTIEAHCDVLVCPPAPYVSALTHLKSNTNLQFGFQDCSAHDSGAYTGEVSASMVKDCGGSYVILGHSERRQYHGESDFLIQKKANAALEQNLTVIICVGESEAERAANAHKEVVEKQIRDSLPKGAAAKSLVVAYEPVWAIGTGNTAMPEDVAIMHAHIRHVLGDIQSEADSVRILYGGSMKPANARELLAMPNVDGGLIGGASLDDKQFISVAKAAVFG